MPPPSLSKRDLLARFLGQPLLAPGRQKPDALRILAYHRVVELPWEDFPFDEQIISASPAAFELQMRFAARNFDLVSFADLASCEAEGKSWPKRALIVTFDDGYRDNFTLAYPILRALKLPATIFLATGHIGQRKLFWWDAIAWCFKTTALAAVQCSELGESAFPLGTKVQKRAAIDAALRWCKGVSECERSEFVAGLPARLEVPLGDEVAAGMHLNWDEVREMARGGIEFGAHTVTHPILNRVEAAQLEFEVAQSKRDIERELASIETAPSETAPSQSGQRVLAFAYPAGTRERRDLAARASVEACSFRFAVAYDEGVEAAPDRFALPRIHVDRNQSLPLFRANLLFPGLMLRR